MMEKLPNEALTYTLARVDAELARLQHQTADLQKQVTAAEEARAKPTFAFFCNMLTLAWLAYMVWRL